MQYPKLVTSRHYHLWTDALHARALAQQTRNIWDRGTYVRWAIATAWTCFESACKDALEAQRLGDHVKEDLDRAVAAKSLPKIHWGSGIWQQVERVHQLRIDYVHRDIPQERLFPTLAEADLTITALRKGIRSIYRHAQKTTPDWIQDDQDRGWDGGNTDLIHGTVVVGGADENDPESIRLTYIYRGKEYTRAILRPASDISPYTYELLRTGLPISAIRVYRGQELINEQSLLKKQQTSLGG
jgi:hypothetical protein